MAIRRLVFAHDLERASHGALLIALELAVRLEAELHLVHVLAPTSAARRASAESALGGVVDTLFKLGCDAKAHVVEDGDVVDGIARQTAALEADLLVVGAPADRARRASATDRLVRSGPCPVLTVRASEDPDLVGGDPTLPAA